MKTLGCYLIVKNEEKNINNCLDNLSKFCDEIVVVDTGSSDMTIPKVMSYSNVTLEHFDWVGDFSAARNYAMSKTKSDYIFSIDADEIFTDELIERLQSLKHNDFNNYTAFEMCLRLTEDKWYLGGRQIIKNDGKSYWKYKIHEKLYNDESRVCILDGEGEWIIHTPDNPYGNWDTYQEIYYNDINSGEVLNENNKGHYFYYLFYTLKDCDDILSKKYLYRFYDKKNIILASEKLQVNLLKSGFIDDDEFNIYLLINLYNDAEIVLEYVDKLCKNEIPTYNALSWCYENNGKLTEKNHITLSYLSYKYGYFRDFIKLTYEQKEKFPYRSEVTHNINFIENTLNKLKDYQFIIDCSGGKKYVSSLIYYISQYTDNILFIINDEKELKDIGMGDLREVNFIKTMDSVQSSKVFKFDASKKYDRFEIKEIIESEIL